MWNNSFGFGAASPTSGVISFEDFTKGMSWGAKPAATSTSGSLWGGTSLFGGGLGGSFTNIFGSLTASIGGFGFNPFQPQSKPEHHEQKPEQPEQTSEKTPNKVVDTTQPEIKPQPDSPTKLRFPPPNMYASSSELWVHSRNMLPFQGAEALKKFDTEHWTGLAEIYGADIKQDEKGHFIDISNSMISWPSTNWIEPGKSKDNPDGLRVRINLATPIAVDLNGDGKIGVTGSSTAYDAVDRELGETVQFDIDGNGTQDTTEWFAGDGDGILVDNRDGNAADTMSGTRLFGDQGGQFENGYTKLAQLDTDGDGKLTGDELTGLTLWVDNGDAKVQDGEFKTLDELGVTELSTERQDKHNERGETLMQSAATINGESVLTEDVWFKQA